MTASATNKKDIERLRDVRPKSIPWGLWRLVCFAVVGVCTAYGFIILLSHEQQLQLGGGNVFNGEFWLGAILWSVASLFFRMS
jgi:hypothetical protein